MTTNGDNKAMLTCPKCNQRFSATPPQPDQPMNALKFTVVVATHEKPIRCPGCKAHSIWVATEVQVVWSTLPITDEVAATLVESKIIIPPLGLVPRLH